MALSVDFHLSKLFLLKKLPGQNCDQEGFVAILIQILLN